MLLYCFYVNGVNAVNSPEERLYSVALFLVGECLYGKRFRRAGVNRFRIALYGFESAVFIRSDEQRRVTLMCCRVVFNRCRNAPVSSVPLPSGAGSVVLTTVSPVSFASASSFSRVSVFANFTSTMVLLCLLSSADTVTVTALPFSVGCCSPFTETASTEYPSSGVIVSVVLPLAGSVTIMPSSFVLSAVIGFIRVGFLARDYRERAE